MMFRCKWCKRIFETKVAAEKHGIICGMEFDVK